MGKKLKKILILGGKGMLGNALVKHLSSIEYIQCICTTSILPVLGNERQFRLQSESCIEDVQSLFAEENYDYVINCIGVIRPDENINAIKDTFFVNSYFPQILAQIASQNNARLIHVSTDCVFSGKKGNYSDMDIPDETSVYGVSKFLGEIKQAPHITLRTSIIGRELGTTRNLLDWFLSNPDGSTIRGYSNVFWNGVTTLTLAKIIERIIDQDLLSEGGLFQIGSEKVSKYDLLTMAKEVYGRDIEIVPDDSQFSDKTIISSSLVTGLFGDILCSIQLQLSDLYKFYQ